MFFGKAVGFVRRGDGDAHDGGKVAGDDAHPFEAFEEVVGGVGRVDEENDVFAVLLLFCVFCIVYVMCM